jgi:hypothetical protein
MTRDVARRLAFLLLRASSALPVLLLASAVVPACYTNGGGGTDPPTETFYFPVGLAVSAGGNALYVANSDFDLQWNGGTLQSYDLFAIRGEAITLLNLQLDGGAGVPAAAADGGLHFIEPYNPGQCTTGLNITATDAGVDGAFPPDNTTTNPGGRIPPGEACAPVVESQPFVRDSVIIGAFATDLQLQTANYVPGTRLFAPVRGDATLTYADVGVDDAMHAPNAMGVLPDGSNPFTLQCGAPKNGQCDNLHRVGNDGLAKGDTRGVTMPGEPFGMAQTQDGTAVAITHQIETQASLLLAGDTQTPPSMQFVLDNIVNGGSGIAFIPHDVDSSVRPCEVPPKDKDDHRPCVRPAFIETSHAAAELDLLRYWNDDGAGPNSGPSMPRPFLTRDAALPFTTNFGGTASYGITMDPTPRLACKVPGADNTPCGDTPARIFFANRSPASVVFGTVGGPSPAGDGTFDPDLVQLQGNIPLPDGPSRVYMAPIVDLEGRYEMRVFVVSFDSSTISVFDPANPDPALVQYINVGPGPFAMAFDPFDINAVAKNGAVPADPRYPAPNTLNRYRFAYVASFTQSYVQIIDLDQRQPTFENVVFNLGRPTPPKGSH